MAAYAFILFQEAFEKCFRKSRYHILFFLLHFEQHPVFSILYNSVDQKEGVILFYLLAKFKPDPGNILLRIFCRFLPISAVCFQPFGRTAGADQL